MMLKSISSFVASILLIAFTISSGIIIYYFVSTLPRTQMQEVNIQSSRVLSCAGALFDVKVRNCNLLNGLVLWLRMDEGSGYIAYDSSGNGNNGILLDANTTNADGNTPPFWVNGRIGKALQFDGVDDYVSIPNPLPSSVCSATITAWSYDIGMVPYGPSGGVVAGWGNGWMNTEYNDNNLRFELRNSSVGNAAFISGSYKDRWLFTALVLDSGKPYGYVNDSLAWSISPNIGCIGLPYWRIGVWDRYFNGTIDEVRIYNRALSAEEIQKLYYNGLENKFNITIGLFNFGYADLGNSFIAYVYLNNGTILQRSLIFDNNLKRGYYLEKNLTIEGYYPSYGLVDKIMVCSNDCQGVCSEVIVNNEC